MEQNQILDEHPDLETDDIKAALVFAVRRTKHPFSKAA